MHKYARLQFWTIFLVMSPLTLTQQLLPALIAAGAMLVGGMMSAKAQKEEAERNRKFTAEQNAYSNQIDAIKTGVQGEQSAFFKLMDSYKGIT